jgi:hypothetical protein
MLAALLPDLAESNMYYQVCMGVSLSSITGSLRQSYHTCSTHTAGLHLDKDVILTQHGKRHADYFEIFRLVVSA